MATDNIKEIKEALTSKTAIVGTQETLKFLKLGKIAKVFISQNAPEMVKDAINNFKDEAEIVQLDIQNDEFGTVCKKPYPISIFSVIKV